MKTVRNVLTTATAALLFMTATPCWSTEGGEGHAVEAIAVKDNMLTVQVRNMPLKDLLLQIAKQANVEIVVHGAADAQVSADFSRTSLEEGLKRVAPGFNIAFTYSAEKREQAKPKVERIALYSQTSVVDNTPPLILSSSPSALVPNQTAQPVSGRQPSPASVQDEPDFHNQRSPEDLAKLRQRPHPRKL